MLIPFLSIILLLFFPVNSFTEQVNNAPKKSRLLLASSSELHGGSGGNSTCTLEASDPNAVITKICIHHVQYRVIGSIQVYFSNGESSERCGGTNAEQECFAVKDGECIIRVFVATCILWHRLDIDESHSFVNTLRFVSSDGSESPLYGEPGSCHGEWLSNDDACLRKITVRYGTMVDAISFEFN